MPQNSERRRFIVACQRKIRHARQIDALHALRVSPGRATRAVVYNADSLSMNSPATLLVEEIAAAIRAQE